MHLGIFILKMQCVKFNTFFQVHILSNFLSSADLIRNLGVWFDSDFSFSRHIQNTCKSCFAQIWDLKDIRNYLTLLATLMAAKALVN